MSKRRWEPVAYDKSIRPSGRMFEAVIRMDDVEHKFERHSILEAQKLLDCFPNEVYEGHDVPKSVFYPRSNTCVTAAM